MTDTLWKRTERTIAKRLGGERMPVNGRGKQPDVQTEWLAVECKTRRRLPTWLHDAVQQAVAGAGPNRLPLVVLHQTGERYADAVVLLRLDDFMAWFGPVDGGGDAEDGEG